MTGPSDSPSPVEPRKSIGVKIANSWNSYMGQVLRVLFGIPFVAFGGWIIFKDVAPDGHVELTTAAVGLTIAVLGAFIIDKDAILQFGDFAKNIIPTIRGK